MLVMESEPYAIPVLAAMLALCRKFSFPSLNRYPPRVTPPLMLMDPPVMLPVTWRLPVMVQPLRMSAIWAWRLASAASARGASAATAAVLAVMADVFAAMAAVLAAMADVNPDRDVARAVLESVPDTVRFPSTPRLPARSAVTWGPLAEPMASPAGEVFPLKSVTPDDTADTTRFPAAGGPVAMKNPAGLSI